MDNLFQSIFFYLRLGPLLPETCDILDIPTRQRENLTVHLCGEYLL